MGVSPITWKAGVILICVGFVAGAASFYWRNRGREALSDMEGGIAMEGQERSEISRLFGAAQFGNDEEVTRILKEMDRPKRQELIMACEFVLETARMMQRGSYRL